MPYTYRTVKGSPLTHEEYDENFAYTETLMEETEAARDVAVSAGNFQGRWSDQHGSVAPPYAVAHNGRTWALNVELFDVTASEPSEANADWTLLLGTVATKNVGTGPEEVPLNSSFGTAASKNTGTAPGDVPLNSDLSSLLGTAAERDIGSGADQVPLNVHLGSAAYRAIGTGIGNVPYFINANGNPAYPPGDGRFLTNMEHPVKEALNAVGYPPVFGIRAWVRYASGGTIISSGNVSAVVYRGTDNYEIHFTIPMPDANYVVLGKYDTILAFTATYVYIKTAQYPAMISIMR